MYTKDQKLITSAVIVILFAASIFAYTKFMKDKNMADENTPINHTQVVTNPANIEVIPIEHATMVLKWGDKVIYTDPTGGAKAFKGEPSPDIILLTHSHPDHFNVETLQAVSKDKTAIIAPISMADMLPGTIAGTFYVMKNGLTTKNSGFSVEAVPMYNVPQKADSPHKKGEGNGYVVEAGGKRVYISGDTGNTPEMRNLKNIDKAFVSMNLPYTMSVQDAATAVLAMKPKQVYPYHYKGSDVNKFKELVNKGDPNIEVVLLDWYPE